MPEPTSASGTGAARAPSAPSRWTPANLTPGYFAGVMATGIVSIGALLIEVEPIASALYWLTLVFYAVLVVLNVWRFVAYRSNMARDFRDPSRAFGFFTFIAATDVVAATTLGIGFDTAAFILLVVASLTWLVLGYVIPFTAVLGTTRRPVLDTANGTWFIWVVASQSIAVVAAGLEPIMTDLRDILSILAIAAWSVGLFLYGACAVFVALRMLLYRLDPQQLDPPYWVAMGAVAISVVAGARIVEMEDSPMVHVTRDLVAGLSVVLWAFATWLIPVLFLAGVWRHFVHRIPLRYEPTMWSFVFPMGMYSVAGIYLGRADDLPVVEAVGSAWFWVAFTVWAATSIAMLVSLVRKPKADAAPA